jgi:hypothetical protein
VFTWANVFYARCELKCNRCATVAVPLEYDLGTQFAPLHPRQEGHPSEDLRHSEGQAEAVGEVVVPTRPAFDLQALALQWVRVAPASTASGCAVFAQG